MATTLFFTRQPLTPSLPAFSPLVSASWTRSNLLERFRLLTDRPDTQIQGSGKNFGATTASSSAHYQWISPPLAKPVTIAGAMRFVMAASQFTNETANLTLTLRVVKPDGTQRGQLFSGFLPMVGGANPVVVSSSAVQTRILGTDTLTSVAALQGDRIVAEVGFTTTSAPTNASSLLAVFGADAGVADHAWTAGVTTGLNPWVSFTDSTLYFSTETPSSNTRLYLSRVLGAPTGFTAPAASGSWLRSRPGFNTNQLVLRKTDPDSLGFVSIGANPLGGTTTGGVHFGTYISPPLDRDQTIAGTVALYAAATEQTLTENAYLAFVLRCVSPLGVVRGTLASVMSQTGTEFPTGANGQRKQSATISTLACVKGDRLVLEIGVFAVTPSNTGSVSIAVGAFAGTEDVIGDEAIQVLRVPFLEFSQSVTFYTGTFLGVYVPDTPTGGVEFPLSVLSGSFSDLTEFGGSLKRAEARNLLSDQWGGKRRWHCQADFQTSDALDQFLAAIDAAPGADVGRGIRNGSKAVQLYSDPTGALRTRFPQDVRIDVGQAVPWENPDPAYSGNTGWTVDLTFLQV